jgi:hypothetical protein
LPRRSLTALELQFVSFFPRIMPSTVALASLAFGITTVALFLYMLMIPLIHGQELKVRVSLLRASQNFHPHRLAFLASDQYRAWRESRFLSTVIPVRLAAASAMSSSRIRFRSLTLRLDLDSVYSCWLVTPRADLWLLFEFRFCHGSPWRCVPSASTSTSRNSLMNPRSL